MEIPIKKVKEVYDADDANTLLSQGWVLLNVVQDSRTYDDGTGYSRAVYILGLENKL